MVRFLVSADRFGARNREPRQEWRIGEIERWSRKWRVFRFRPRSVENGPDGHPNSPTCGHPKFLHPERGVTAS